MNLADVTSPTRAESESLLGRIFSWFDTTAIMAAADIGLPDALGSEPRTADEVATTLAVDAATIARLLRILTGTGVVTTLADGRFALTPQGQLLRSDVPGSIQALFRLSVGPLGAGLIAGRSALQKTANTAFEEVHGVSVYDYLSEHPEQSSIFNNSMVNFGVAMGGPPIDAYDFTGLRKLIDVGGGHGQLVTAILDRNPVAEGVVFDTPDVIAEATVTIAHAGLATRCQCIAGDFFTSVPAGGDCYLLRSVIHNWDDAQARTILTRCREAIDSAGRLLLFEIVMPDSDDPHPAKTFDWVMMTCVGGRERTEAEYAALLSGAGFRLLRTIHSESPMSVLEAVPV